MSLSAAGRSLQLLSRIFDAEVGTEPFLPPFDGKESLPLRAAAHPLPRISPEAEGISSRHLRHFLEELARSRDLRIQNALVLRHGKLLCAAAFGAQTLLAPKHTFSAAKSVTSLAVGLLLDDGRLHLEDTVADIFGEALPPIAHRRLRETRVEDLLTMRSGIRFSEMQTVVESDWLHAIFTGIPEDEPGKVFRYNSLNTYLLSAAIRQVTGDSLTALLQTRLFSPMGITDVFWEGCPRGIEKGGWGLYIRPEDMAKLGQLVLNGGEWEGQQLISRAYITAATTAAVSPENAHCTFDYGYHIWVGRDENCFLFNGMLGQNVIGFKDSGILVLTNAGADTEYQESRYFEIVSRYFGGNFPHTLPKNTDEQERLADFIRSISLYHAEVDRPRENAAAFMDQSFAAADKNAPSAGLLPLLLQVLRNNYTKGIKSLAVSIRGDFPELIWREKDALHRFPVGLGVPQISELRFGDDRYHVAACGHFTHDEEDRPVFCVRLEFPETPCVRILKLVLTEDGLLLRMSETPGVPYVFEKLREASRHPLLKPLLLAALGGTEEDYLLYRVRRVFSPEIRMTQENK